MALRYDTISFLSDYGHDDEFVGVVQSVIRAIAPEVAVIDVTHQVPPHDVRAGGLALARSAQYLCPGVVLAVVDPGVGGARRAVAVEVGDGASVLVGPDNGLLAPAVALVGGADRAVELTEPDYQLEAPGPTFAGRDVFAPAAAHLCAGVDLAELGPEIDPAGLLPGRAAHQPPRRRRGCWWPRSCGSTGTATPSSTWIPTRSADFGDRMRPARRRRSAHGPPGRQLRRDRARARSGWWSTPTACCRSPSTGTRRPSGWASRAGAAVLLEAFDDEQEGAARRVRSRPSSSVRPGAGRYPMRKGTTIALAMLLVAILGAAFLQLVIFASACRLPCRSERACVRCEPA